MNYQVSSSITGSLAQYAAPMFLVHFISDAGARQAHELRNWRVRSARAAGQRGNKAGHGRVTVAIERAKVDRIDCSAGWAAHPQEPIAGGEWRRGQIVEIF